MGNEILNSDEQEQAVNFHAPETDRTANSDNHGLLRRLTHIRGVNKIIPPLAAITAIAGGIHENAEAESPPTKHEDINHAREQLAHKDYQKMEGLAQIAAVFGVKISPETNFKSLAQTKLGDLVYQSGRAPEEDAQEHFIPQNTIDKIIHEIDAKYRSNPHLNQLLKDQINKFATELWGPNRDQKGGFYLTFEVNGKPEIHHGPLQKCNILTTMGKINDYVLPISKEPKNDQTIQGSHDLTHYLIVLVDAGTYHNMVESSRS